jgi:carbon monoxide dehydrogenase subunit G
MQLDHTFTVPVGADEAFRILRDIERIGPCMPGATITSAEGEEFAGKVKVKVGPIQVTYQGTARFVSVDEAARTAVIEANGKEARGPGTARATITATCEERGDATEVRVQTDLAVTGRPAQFGRGVMSDVGDKLLGQFADCLAEELSPSHEPVLEDRAPDAQTAAEGAGGVRAPAQAEGPGQPAEDVATPAVTREAAPSGAALQRRTDDTIDLLDVAGASVAKRAAPVLALVVLALVVRWLRRRR